MRIGTMRCSFCRRPDAEVSKLVAGPRRLFAGRVYICDRCAAQTIEIMEQSSGNPPQTKTAPLFRRILSRLHVSLRKQPERLQTRSGQPYIARKHADVAPEHSPEGREHVQMASGHVPLSAERLEKRSGHIDKVRRVHKARKVLWFVNL